MISVGLTSVVDVIACSLMYELNGICSYMFLLGLSWKIWEHWGLELAMSTRILV